MKKRYVYLLLFLVPGLFTSLLITLTLFGAVYGTFWLFVYGDSAWPDWTEQVMPILMLVIFSGIWIGTIVTGYCVGKKLETSPGFDFSIFGYLWEPRCCRLSLCCCTSLALAILGQSPMDSFAVNIAVALGMI